jgi:hypothetical protein
MVIIGLSAMNDEKEIAKWFEDGIDYFCKLFKFNNFVIISI